MLMDEDFEMPVTYKNQELIFIAKFIQFGYSYKFEVDVNGILVFFEPDEERKLRAIIDPTSNNANRKIDKELIELIMESLTGMMK
jgi:hypothetical protein